MSLGAGRVRQLATVVIEHFPAILAAILAAFGRAIGEVGISMMLGGNIRYYTRTMTTAIALETNRGAFDLAIALGILLLSIALLVNGVFRTLADRDRPAKRRQRTRDTEVL